MVVEVALSTPVLDAHRTRLTQAFGRDVVALQPGSLLDVGCGAGLLLAELAALGVAVRGIEQSARRVLDARALGLDVLRGDASALPFEEAACDWVVIRHVLHHLDDPAAAVGEAWRVARIGVILAEPFCDPSVPAQVVMAQLDALTSELLARGGHIHHAYLDAAELLALLPERYGRVVTRTYAERTRVPALEVQALVRLAAGKRGLTRADLERVEELARAAASGQLAYNGSLAVFVQLS